MDKEALEIGKRLYPHFEFIHGSFPQVLGQLGMRDRRWDYVMLNAWFSQVQDWKSLLLNLALCSNKYINVSLNFRLCGSTVLDPDVSYFYYLDSGIRVLEVTHNLFEFLNYASVHEIGASRIDVHAYTRPEKKTSAFRPLRRSEQIQGNVLITRKSDRLNSFPMGGVSNEALSHLKDFNLSLQKPHYEVVINGELIEV